MLKRESRSCTKGNRGTILGASSAEPMPVEHAPEIAPAVEAPPVPLQHIRRRIAAPQSGDDPDHDFVDRSDAPAKQHADHDHAERSQVAEAHIGFGRGVGIDVALVDVIDKVRRSRVDGGCKVGHEGRQQAGDQEAQQAHRDKAGQRHRQHQFKVHVRSHGAQVGTEEGRRQHRQTHDEEVAGRGEHDVDPGAHHRGLARVLGGENALHVVVRRGSGHGNRNALEEQHHHEEAEEFVAVFGDLLRRRRQDR